MIKLKLYNISDEYIKYLLNFDRKVFSNKEEDRKKERKYLGTVLHINDLKYFVPLSSPKESDYTWIDGKKVIRKSVIPIMRIVVKNNSGNDELKGTLKFSNMIPVPDCALIDYDVNNEADEDYKILVTKEISFIKSNSESILKNAQVIYNQKTNKYNINYLKDTVEFLLLEQKCKEYEIVKQCLENLSQQIAVAKDTTKS
ncbi:MAG: type III toxin-antitoxin system ToxN/AbiQ family toxin [Desulfitobacterium hafniense]|nr:type III toxin-antitoxin system ToxN/AbiQ family toxin [Desulfitobacterium hafniense]